MYLREVTYTFYNTLVQSKHFDHIMNYEHMLQLLANTATYTHMYYSFVSNKVTLIGWKHKILPLGSTCEALGVRLKGFGLLWRSMPDPIWNNTIKPPYTRISTLLQKVNQSYMSGVYIYNYSSRFLVLVHIPTFIIAQ